MPKLEWRHEQLEPGARALSGRQSIGRYFLDARPVHCGDVLEVRLQEAWERGRHEWSREAGATLETAAELVVLGPESELRWPEAEAS